MGNCPSDQELDAGLCYPKCPTGFTGVGPVCWEDCPSDFPDTGTGCTKPTYDRGVGTIPEGCTDDKENQDGLCYEPCNDGYTGAGPVCWGDCPSGFTDIGAFCQKPESYGRGIGYISESLCRESGDHGASSNGCELSGWLWYPKCDPNFHAVGCCICSPDCPSGWTDTGTGCTKPSYGRGAGTIPDACNNNREYSDGLCYEKCREGYSGAVTLCTRDCPSGMEDIGLFCQKQTQTRGVGTVPSIHIAWWVWVILAVVVFLIIGGIVLYIVLSTRKPPPAVINLQGIESGKLQNPSSPPA